MYSSSDRENQVLALFARSRWAQEMEPSTMRWNRIECKPHFGGMARRGLAWRAIGATGLLLVANGGWASAQAAAPAAEQSTAPTQTSAPATAPATAAAASSMDIVGTWQGTLHIAAAADHPEINLRIENKITKDDKGDLKVVDYSIDQGGQPMAATKASFANGIFKYVIEGIGGGYEGTMSADGKTITGTWTQGPRSLPLNLDRVNADTAWAIPEPPKPMAADADPSLEVATIKPSQPDRQGRAFLWRGNQFTTFNTTLMSLIGFAYAVQDKEVISGPDWMSSDKFDIEGKPDTPGTPTTDQLRVMVKKLLADRFQLKFHNDKRELSAYVLTAGKTGPKMTKDDTNPNGLPGLFFRQLGDLNVRNATMADFAHLMQSAVLDRPVVDQTALTGKWDFELKWTPDESQFSGMGVRPPPPSDAPDAPPPLFTAIQEQLGLKLDSGKAQVDVMVVDHVEKPSPN
ncbi:MAG: TIGR03435 family protein [Terracidiphilus sp.]